jgi:Raf kinase inhibitor-like YbhB/YbcL family protein
MHAINCLGSVRTRQAYRNWPLVLLAAALLTDCSRTSDAQGTAAASRANTGSPRESAMPAPAPASTVAIDRVRAASGAAIRVSSPDLQAQAAIPAHFTAYGDGVSPAVQWTRVEGAKSYALLVEDPDAKGPQPFVHWVAWNIPADVQSLGEGLPAPPRGMQQGRNGRDAAGYFGPRPPAGDPPHHYHFEVFALDAPLALPADADRDALVAAIGPHLIGSGELIATSQAPAGAH